MLGVILIRLNGVLAPNPMDFSRRAIAGRNLTRLKDRPPKRKRERHSASIQRMQVRCKPPIDNQYFARVQATVQLSPASTQCDCVENLCPRHAVPKTLSDNFRLNRFDHFHREARQEN